MVLPEHLTIIEISQWKEKFLEQVMMSSVLDLDITPLKKIDSAGIQLLFVVRRALQKNKGDINWLGSSDVLIKNAKWLGMSDALGITL